MSHKELRPEDITALIDTREQRPWELGPLRTMRATLRTGDYSILGLSDPGGIAIERKSLGDLLQCCGGARKRFSEELERLHCYSTRCVIVECSYQEFEQGGWLLGLGNVRSRVSAAAAMGSVLGWISAGIPFLFCPTAEMASTAAARMMFIAAKRRFKELGGFYESLKLTS
jgi:ERCC4 domain